MLIHEPRPYGRPRNVIAAVLRITTALAAGVLLISVPALAQSSSTTTTTVDQIVEFLVLNRGVQTGDVTQDIAAADATRATLTRALLSSVATTPVGSPSGGFTYRLNPELGTVERASDTFGPLYLERALTSGAGQASFGFTFQYASFEKLDGNNLRDGDFVTVSNQFRDEAAPFEVERLSLNITTQTATLSANVGLTDRIDVSVTVPMVRLEIDGSRVNIYRGEPFLQARASAIATGVADIGVRGKVRLTPVASPTAVAGAMEMRLPTGREQDLLGAGELALRLHGIASHEWSRAGVYGNFVLGTGGLGREVSYGGGLAVAPAPRLTLVAELMLRKLAGVQGIDAVVAPNPTIQGVDTTWLVPSGEDELTGFSAFGFKWNVAGRWLVQTHVLVPVSSNGLTARFTPAFAIDYSFGR